MKQQPEFRPQGVFRQPDGTGLWRLWAPFAERVALVLWPGGERTEIEMTPADYGYFTHRQRDVEEGLRYAYRLDGGPERPDPATRWQPDGVHRPSAVFFPESFPWTDDGWRGIPRDDLVIYELHVGTFTPEGTLDAVIPRLPQLRELGITAIELMPVAQFPGGRNWGYDGVHPDAVQNTYGGPQALQRLVDAAHAEGLGVFLDVVYNHVGPEGNYLGEFGPYFTDRYHTPWGKAVNYDGRDSDPVRRFACDNACMWARDFHVDGLRLDAVHAIYDFGARHILAQLQDEVQQEAAGLNRTVHVVAETNQNDVRLVDPPERGGYALSGVWSDDFHHGVHALLTGEREGYFQDFGDPEDLAKAFNDAFVYDGRYSPFRRRYFGSRTGDLDRTLFTVCIKNHDQVGNRAQGDRFETLIPPEAYRLACGLLGISPFVPLVFMGDEYGETRSFPFFCSFGDPELVEAVRRGRRAEFANLEFEWGADIPDPQAPETFESAKLSWDWPEGSVRAGVRSLWRDLLTARRERPGLRDRQRTQARLGGPSGQILVVTRGRGEEIVAMANLTNEPQRLPDVPLGSRALLLSTEEERYGGKRRDGDRSADLAAYELQIFGPESRR